MVVRQLQVRGERPFLLLVVAVASAWGSGDRNLFLWAIATHEALGACRFHLPRHSDKPRLLLRHVQCGI